MMSQKLKNFAQTHIKGEKKKPNRDETKHVKVGGI